MPELTSAGDELPLGGVVRPRRGRRSRDRRLAHRRQAGACDLESCVNCLLCWLYCPDSAVVLDGTTFAGFDYDYCKGCEICAEVCPVDAIAMVAEDDA